MYLKFYLIRLNFFKKESILSCVFLSNLGSIFVKGKGSKPFSVLLKDCLG